MAAAVSSTVAVACCRVRCKQDPKIKRDALALTRAIGRPAWLLGRGSTNYGMLFSLLSSATGVAALGGVGVIELSDV